MDPIYLVTHSGGFHADELLSSVVLTRLFPAARLVRSRDRDWITPGADRIIYDVGGAYDPEARIFDHHQRGAPLRPEGAPYSSFGLVWRHYGMAYLQALGAPEADRAGIHADFDQKFVLPVDLMDNGVIGPDEAGSRLAELTLPMLLESLKPDYDAGEGADDQAFAAALPIARAFVEAAIRRRAASRRADGVVRAAIAAAGSSRVLELPMGMPFRRAVVEEGADHLLFVIHPRGRDWMIGGIRRGEEGFALRADLPEGWAGLTDAALEAATGVEGAKFCHVGRFIAVAETRDGILRMAEQAVKAAEAG